MYDFYPKLRLEIIEKINLIYNIYKPNKKFISLSYILNYFG